MYVGTIVRRGALALGALAGGAALVVAVPGASGQTTSIKRVTITIKCKIQHGASASPCRGTFKMKGGFNDSGRTHNLQSSDSAGTGATMRGQLIGKRGGLYVSTGYTVLVHKRRGCTYAATFSVQSGTETYAGYRGSGVSYCTTIKSSGGAITRNDEFKVKLEKR